MTMKFIKAILTLTLLRLFILNGFEAYGQKKDSTDNIIIYGDSFLFSIHEPIGWKGDIYNAKNFNANIIFYKKKEDVKKGGTIIQVLTYKKTDEEVNKDLEYDINTVKEKNHDLQQKNIDAVNKSYPCFSKLIFVDTIFYKYIAYINPGNKFHNSFSVTMNVSKRLATKEELAAFKEIISTLVVFKR